MLEQTGQTGVTITRQYALQQTVGSQRTVVSVRPSRAFAEMDLAGMLRPEEWEIVSRTVTTSEWETDE